MSEPAEIDPFDAEWDRPRWTNRLTWVLVAAVVAALAFAGGLLIERQYDTTVLTAARTGTRAGGGLAVAGLSGGRAGAGGRAVAGGGASGGAGGSSAGVTTGAGADGGGTAGDAPIAVGTIAAVNADRLTLANFAGKTITVAVPPTATVTTSGLAGLKPGAPVSVTGTTNPDGSVTATSITSRTTGG